jgi:NAD dependent epimerase/dehydratase family enzyme
LVSAKLMGRCVAVGNGRTRTNWLTTRDAIARRHGAFFARSAAGAVAALRRTAVILACLADPAARAVDAHFVIVTAVVVRWTVGQASAEFVLGATFESLVSRVGTVEALAALTCSIAAGLGWSAIR